MITLRAYHLLEDAWTGGVADWCRAASAFVLGGGQAWMVTTSHGQANWIKRRLLCEGFSLFGVRFLDVRSLRRELCLRQGYPPPAAGRHALELILRLSALGGEQADPDVAAIARYPRACLAALDDFAAAGWLDEGPGLFGEFFPAALHAWLPQLRATGSWLPQIDRQLDQLAAPDRSSGSLAVCVFGWDASFWPVLPLLAAVAGTAAQTGIYSPNPRGTAGSVQQSWLNAIEGTLQTTFQPCAASEFVSAQAALAGRLEGSELAAPPDAPAPPAPELLVGDDTSDMAALVCDFVARWLVARPVGESSQGAADGGQRLVLLCPRRGVASVGVVKALAAAGIAAEDEIGEQPEPPLAIQIQRAVVAYHQEAGDIATFLALVVLLNEHAALAEGGSGVLSRVFPLDPEAVRRELCRAFADAQHHSVRALLETASLGHAAVAQPLREFVDHLGEWPEKLPWREMLGRWEQCLAGLDLTTEVLEPLWSQLAGLPIDGEVPVTAFFQFMGGVLGGAPPRRAVEGTNRFARVVVTTLEGASGQTWGGALFLDANEGSWPVYPGENSFLDDAARTRLNTRRAALTSGVRPPPARGHLLTAADRAQLEHFRLLETLENCTGPLAFAGVARDPSEPAQELYANEWLLRCLVESGGAGRAGEALLDRWRRAVRRTHHPVAPLGLREAAHLREVFARRRDPGVPFDDYSFNFSALTDPDELPWTEAWSGRDLETAWDRPATFALQQLFGAAPWREGSGDLHRRESWVVGRLVHRWLRVALNASREPRRITHGDWQFALTAGLAKARAHSERDLRRTLGSATPPGDGAAGLPAWWQSTLSKAQWAARRCLQSLAETAQAPTAAGESAPACWLSLDRSFSADLRTARGPLKLKVRCDAVLLDQPDFAGASGHLIDFRTGASAVAGNPTGAQIDSGRELGLGALLLLGLAEGLQPEATQSGVIGPDAANLAHWTAGNTPTLQPDLAELAVQQRLLVFGQKSAFARGHGKNDAEELPLATSPVPAAVLTAKATLTRDGGEDWAARE